MTAPVTDLVPSQVDPEISQAMAIFERLNPLKSALHLEDLTDGELQVFAMVALHTGLDPFTGQIYAIKRKGKVNHQTGIDGYRAAAEKTRQYAGSEEATFEECDCKAAPADHPKIARVTVHRRLADGHQVDQVGIARWHELYPGPGDDGFMWRKMPWNQLAKCAEANGLRKAFPRVLGGVYIPEEMQQADATVVQEAEAKRIAALPTAGDRLAERRAAIEAQSTASTPPAAADAAPPVNGESDGSPSAAAGEPLTGEVVGEPAGLTWPQFRTRMAGANTTTSRVKAAALELWPDRELSPLPSEWGLPNDDWAALAAHMHI